MRYVYTSDQMKSIENHAMETMGFPNIVLMERAAMSAVSVISEKASQDQQILCVCGTGNNGGDGAAVARMLKQSGFSAALCMVGDAGDMTDITKQQVKMALNCRVKTVSVEAIPSADIIVDALFGTGLSRPIEGVYAEVINQINQSESAVFSIDIPSGVHAGTGKVMGTAVFAQETITFSAHKLGMILYPGAEYAGTVHVADIGLPVGSMASVTNPVYLYESEDIYRLPLRPNYSHKGSFGKVLVIAGSEDMGGAAYLTAKAAFSLGAGMVKVLSSENNRSILLGQLPELLFTPYDEQPDGDVSKQLGELLEDSDVVIIGPGLGQSRRAKQTVDYVLENYKKGMVLDGDGITLSEGKELSENVIMTPHLQEMSVFSHVTAEQLRDHIITEANRISKEAGCVVALKDARTVVCGNSETYVNVTGNNGMATAGSGDVLAGMIGGLLAGGMMPFEAAKLGVFLHGMAGDTAAGIKSKYALTASDIIECLYRILSQV